MCATAQASASRARVAIGTANHTGTIPSTAQTINSTTPQQNTNALFSFQISNEIQFAADTRLQQQANQQVLAAHELQVRGKHDCWARGYVKADQASNALSALQEKLVQV
jgi:hypothetical protein